MYNVTVEIPNSVNETIGVVILNLTNGSHTDGYWTNDTIIHVNTTALNPGNVTLNITAYDNVSISSTSNFTVCVDNLEPNITSATASAYNVTNCSYLNLSVTVKDMEGDENCSGIENVSVNVTKLNETVGRLYLTLDQTTGTIYNGTWNGTVHVNNVTNCSIVNLTINATDKSGNSNTSVNFTITIDNQVPESVIPITPWRYVTNCTYFNLSVNASDSCSDIKNITVNASAINASAVNVTLTPVGAGIYNATVHVSTTKTGNQTLTIYAYDWAGNVNDVCNFEFYVDNTPPSVTVNEPIELCVKNCTNITLRATVTDAGGSGVINVTVNVSAINSTQDNVTLTFDGTYWTDTVHVSTPNSGLQNLTITAYDNKNNKNDSVNMTVKVDNIPPVAAAGPDQLDVAVNEALTFNASDSYDPPPSCCNISNYSWDFGDGNNATGMEVTHSYNTAGDYTVTLNVTDCAGNFNNTGTLNVSVTQELYNIPLYASSGWNLISTPLTPLNDSIENVTANISANLTSVWAYRYNDTSGSMEWRSYTPGDGFDKLNNFEAGWGYWVRMTSNGTLTIKGTFLPIGGEGDLPEYKVYTGWNLIGFHSKTNELASTYLTTKLGDDWTLYKYPFGGDYVQILAAQDMERGYGYWLHRNANGTILPYVVPSGT